MILVPAVIVLDHTEPQMAARINALQRASYAVEAELIGFIGIPAMHQTDAEICQLDLCILGALRDGELVGILGYRRIARAVDIDRLAVHPSAFRSGVGRSLLEELHSRETDALRFQVTTAAKNIPAVALYTNLGYGRAPDRELATGITIASFVRR